MNQRPVIVAGMHRSGTSAVARILDRLGVDLGPEDRLMPAKPDNPEGFWENLDLSHINDELLAGLGGRWDDPPPTDAWQRVAAKGGHSEQAARILAQFSGRPVGFKDPRNSLLLPFWSSVLPEARIVVVIRHPRAVVESLVDRDHMDPERAALLWLRYTFDALGHDESAITVDFDALRRDPMGSVSALAASLDLADDPDRVRAAASALEARLAARQPQDSPHGSVRVAEALHDLIPDLEHSTIATIGAAIRGISGNDQHEAALRTAHGLEVERDRVHDLYLESRKELDKARNDWAHANALAEERARLLADEEAARARLAARLRSLDAEMADAAAELALRRQAQYRFERVLGKRGFRWVSGHPEDPV